MSIRRYTTSMVAMSVVGAFAVTYFLDFTRRDKKMTTQNYISDSFQKHDKDSIGYDQDTIQQEIDKMLLDSQSRGNSYEMKRIPRPDPDAIQQPRRFDQREPPAQFGSSPTPNSSV